MCGVLSKFLRPDFQPVLAPVRPVPVVHLLVVFGCVLPSVVRADTGCGKSLQFAVDIGRCARSAPFAVDNSSTDDEPVTITDAVITGAIAQAEQTTVLCSCTATASSGLVQSVVVDLSAIGGPSSQALAKGSGNQWTGSATILPPSAGVKQVAFTATTGGGAVGSAQIAVEVAPAGMSPVPAGQFQMGDPFSVEGDANERPLHAVYVNKFFVDRTEITAQQYADALNWALAQGNLIAVSGGVVYQYGTGTSHPYCSTISCGPYSRITWSGSRFGVTSGKANHPMTEVSWYGAVAYANWRSAMQGRPLAYDLSTWTCNWGGGYRLPTEAEWEKAARGGAAGHRFPWSDVDIVDFTRANYYSSGTAFYDKATVRGYDPAFSTSGYPFTGPVGSFAGNGYGLYDMAGNVWEWCNDWYDGAYYATSPDNNPSGPATGDNRVLRGGSWGSVALNLRCAYRANSLPTYRGMLNGFRLVLGGE